MLKKYFELLSFSDNDIGQGIRSVDDLKRNKKVWEIFAKGCEYASKRAFLTMHIKVEMKKTLFELKRNSEIFSTLKEHKIY